MNVQRQLEQCLVWSSFFAAAQCTLKGTELYLVADPNQTCFGPSYEQLVLLSYIAIAVYGFGVPCTFCFLVLRHRYLIMADQYLRIANMSDTLATNPYYYMQKRYKRLYFKFNPQTYYWYGG